MGRNKQIAVNIVTSIVSFFLNTIINFFISPYIIEQLGSEAYGFVRLSNDFANYATLLTVALNSMASRFLMVELHRGNKEEANKYYSSLLIANTFLGAVIAIPATLCVIFLEQIVDVPTVLVTQVRLTFAITFVKFIMDLIFSATGLCFYLSNRLDKSNIRGLESNIIKTGLTIGLLVMFGADISFVAAAAFVSSVYVIITNIYYKNKLVPDLKFKLSNFDFDKIKKLLSAGIWNTITKLSQLLTSGLSLLITNIWVGATEMGYLSVAKTIPNLMISFNGSIAGMFTPNMTMLYAENDFNKLIKTVKSAVKMMTMFVVIPNAILVSLGMEFYQLWVPSQPAKTIQILAILTVINSCVTGPIQPIYQIFTVLNKVKQSSKVMIIFGFSSIVITYFVIKNTSVGVYGVTFVSVIGSIFVALLYHIPYSAIYLGCSRWSFYPEVIKSVLSFGILTALGYGIKFLFPITSWFVWFADAIILGILGLVFNFFFVLSVGERKKMLDIVKKKFSKS